MLILQFPINIFIDFNKDEMDFDDLEKLFNTKFSYFRMAKRQLESGTHILQKKGLIENAYNDGFEDTEAFSLTDKAKDELLFELEDQLSKKPYTE
jgi:hypothetical protein